MFNAWKKNIVEVTQEEYISLYRKGILGSDFPILRNYLKTIPDVQTSEEVQNVTYVHTKDNPGLSDAVHKYNWKQFDGWVHIYSKDVKTKKEARFPIEQRLYLNTESMHTYKMALAFVRTCDRRGLPYRFKFDVEGNCDDTMVIYSSNELLFDYLDVLSEIKAIHPEIIAEINDPPLLTGKIDGWIGIGSEPPSAKGKRQSFNSRRSDLIETIIQVSITLWIMERLGQSVTYGNQSMSLLDFMAYKMTENRIDDLKKRWNNRVKYFKEINSQAYDESEVIQNLGYTLKEISDPAFFSNLFATLKTHVKPMLEKIRTQDDEDIKITTSINGQKLYFYKDDILRVIKDETMKIVNTDAWLLDFIQDMIKKNGAKEGIDPNMFCFDIGIKEKLESIYAQRVKKDKPSDTTLSIEEIKRLIDYYDERGDYKKSAEFKVKLARMTTLIIDYDSISKNILDEMNIAEASLDYQKVSELRCQLAIIKYAQQNDNLSYEEKIALYADRIKSAEDNGDYVSRAVWMQLLDIVDEAKKRHF